jgi:tetratricopeptide (TPR) repeat protein
MARGPDEKLQAFLVLERVLRDDPRREDVRRKVIRLAMSPALALQLVSQALNHLEVLQELHPGEGELSDLMGRCYLFLGKDKEAKEYFEWAVDLNPDLVQTYGRLAAVLRFKFNEPREAD